MRIAGGIARTRRASGRFLVLLLLSACTTVGGGGGPVAEGPPPVIVQPGELSGAQEAEARALWTSARASFQARRFFEALRTTDEILSRYPAAEVSGDALRMTARARLEVGEGVAADATAQRYLDLLPTGDPRAPEMRLLQARARGDDPAEQLDRLLRIGDEASPAEVAEGRSMAVSAVDALDYRDVRAVLDEVGTATGPVAPVVEARLAVSLLEMGQTADAEGYAARALDGGISGEERVWAEGVIRGELPPGRGRVTEFSIGLVLPIGGPPALAEFAAGVAEGVEVAAATVLGEDFNVTVITRDDEGDPTLAAQTVAELEAEGVAGMVGFLLDDVFVSAGDARSGSIPLVSPTARTAALAGEASYSLEGPEPEAAAAVARYAAARAFQRIAIVHPMTPEAEVEADAFEAAAEALGMPVVGRFGYQSGATFFEEQLIGARNALRQEEIAALGLTEDDTLHAEMLEPAAVFLPIPPEDVEFLAPQVVHYGLDTLAIEVLGTSGWTDPQTLASVDPRHTNGVVATAALTAIEGDAASAPGDAAFQRAYESYFQRSLVGTTPGLGYDAALILLEALRPGRIAPEQVNAALARLQGVRGATGVYSVVDGRVVRAKEVVRIQDRVPVAEPAAFPSESGR